MKSESKIYESTRAMLAARSIEAFSDVIEQARLDPRVAPFLDMVSATDKVTLALLSGSSWEKPKRTSRIVHELNSMRTKATRITDFNPVAYSIHEETGITIGRRIIEKVHYVYLPGNPAELDEASRVHTRGIFSALPGEADK